IKLADRFRQSATSLPYRHRPIPYPPIYRASSTDKHYILGLLSSKNPTSDKSLPKAEPQGHPPVFAHLWFLFVAFRQESHEFDRKQLDFFGVVVGNCINEDASLASVVATPGLKQLLSKRIGISDADFIAFAKTEAFDAVAANASNELLKSRANIPPPTQGTATASTSPSANANDSNSPLVIPKNATVEVLRGHCKTLLLALFDDAGHPIGKKDPKGKAKSQPGKPEAINLPFNSIPQHLSENGLQLINWPILPQSPWFHGGSRKEGIKCLNSQNARLLLSSLQGLDCPKIYLQKVDDSDALTKCRIPVVITCPPPAGVNAPSHGDVCFADGNIQECSLTHGLPSGIAAPPPPPKPSNIKPTATVKQPFSNPPPPPSKGPRTRSRVPLRVVAVGSSDDETSQPSTQKEAAADPSGNRHEVPPSLPNRPLPRPKKPVPRTPVNSDIDQVPSSRSKGPATAGRAPSMQREKSDAADIFEELQARVREAFPTSDKSASSARAAPTSFSSRGPSVPTEGNSDAPGNASSTGKRTSHPAAERPPSPPKKPRLSPVGESDESVHSPGIPEPIKGESAPPPLGDPTPVAPPATQPIPVPTPLLPPAILHPTSSAPISEHSSTLPAVTGASPGAWDPYRQLVLPGHGSGFNGGYFGAVPGYGQSYEWGTQGPPPSNNRAGPNLGFPPNYGPMNGTYGVPPYSYGAPHLNMPPHFLHPAYGGHYGPVPLPASHPHAHLNPAHAGVSPSPHAPDANSGQANAPPGRD
ncbi:hypothetical protein H0H93_006400, partial [Arthromyces matolae]